MSFLAGFLAFFTILGAIPIIIHLLNRRQFKIVVWAAMDFLLKTLQKNSRRLQIRDLILLLLRVAAVVFLALALARPTIAPGRLNLLGHQSETAAVVVLDNSMSMGFSASGAENNFDVAKRRAKDVINQLPKGSAAGLILMSDIAVDDISEPSHDVPFALDEVGRAPLGDGGTDVVQSLAKALKNLAATTASSREIYLVTDMQTCAWPAPTDPAWAKIKDEMSASKPPVTLFIVDAGSSAPADNVAVDSLTADDEVITTESDTDFSISVHNYSATPARNVTVELNVGDAAGGEMRKAASTVIDQLEGAQQVRLAARFEEGGDHRVEVTTSLDHLGADNRRSLAVNVIDRVKVLLIDGEPSPTDDPFLGETGFLQAALQLPDPNDEQHRSLIEADICTLANLAEKSLQDYSAVVLANVGELPTGLADGLKSFVQAEGKGLIIFLGQNVQPSGYNQTLFDQAGLLPGRLGDQVAEAGDAGISLSTEELTHPVVSFFRDKDNQPYLTKPRFRRYFPIEIPKQGAHPETKDDATDHIGVVARFANGSPAITERTVGRGSVLLFASTADKAWTDFPLTPAFLMIVRRATQHVALGRRPTTTLPVHSPIVIWRGAKEAGAVVNVRGPRGDNAQVAAVPSPQLGLAKIEFTDTHFAGFYQVRDANDPSQVQWFAANAPRAESNLETYTESALKERYPDLAARWITPGADIASAVSEQRSGKEIWPLLFAIVVMSLLAESILAVRWAPKGA